MVSWKALDPEEDLHQGALPRINYPLFQLGVEELPRIITSFPRGVKCLLLLV